MFSYITLICNCFYSSENTRTRSRCEVIIKCKKWHWSVFWLYMKL